VSNDRIIDCRRVTKRYGSTVALNRFSLDVRSGQVFALLGENGAGKTTLMRLILGLHWPDDGEVLVFGENLMSDREGLLARIGSLIEFPSFYPHLTGRENIEIVRRLRSLQRSETDRVLELVGLGSASRRRAAGYSQGMKQRLAIAMALLGSPQLVILDEPTNGLDPNGIREVRELITGLPARTGATVLVSSHLLAEVEQIADRVAIVQKGSLLFGGTLEELTLREAARVSIATSETERASELLSRAGIPVERTEGRLIVGCAGERIPEINKMLVEGGIPVWEITHQRLSLEQLYFNLTGSSHR
jgi:ABC-type multidrug transport system ATPase subunit